MSVTKEDLKKALFVLLFFGGLILYFFLFFDIGSFKMDMAPAPDYVDEVPVIITIEKKATNTDVT